MKLRTALARPFLPAACLSVCLGVAGCATSGNSHGETGQVEPAASTETDAAAATLARDGPRQAGAAQEQTSGPLRAAFGAAEDRQRRPGATGRFSEAEQQYLRALSIAQSAHDSTHPNVAGILINLAGLYYSQGRMNQAESSYRRAIGIFEAEYGDGDPRVGAALNNLAAVRLAQHRYSEAATLYERARTIFSRKFGNGHPHVATIVNNIAKLKHARILEASDGDSSRENGRAFAEGGAEAALLDSVDLSKQGVSGRSREDQSARTRPKEEPGLEPDEGASNTISAAANAAVAAERQKLSHAWDLDADGNFQTLGPSAKFGAAEINGLAKKAVEVRVSDGNGTFEAHGASVGPIEKTVRARAGDDEGGFTPGEAKASIKNALPNVTPGGPYAVDEGATVMIGAVGDDGMAADQEALTISWDLDGDGTYETNGKSTLYDAAHEDGPRTRSVQVRASDDDGASSFADVKIAVRNAPPSVTPGGPYEVSEGSSVVISAAGSDPAIPDQAALRYDWDLDGDGAFETSGQR